MRLLQQVVVLSFVLAAFGQSAMGANGSQLTSVSPVNRGMGGVGVGTAASPAEMIFKNPAALSALDFGKSNMTSEVGFTLAGLSTEANLGAGNVTQSGNTVTPTIGFAYSMGDLTFGAGLFGFSGVNVDYAGNALVNGIKTSYRVVRLGLGASYKINPILSFGVEPFLTYSDLAIQLLSPFNSHAPHGGIGFGVQTGLFAKIADNFTAGANFTTGSSVNHKDIVDFDALSPAPVAASTGVLDSFKITTPWEFGLGVNYKPVTEWQLALDWRYLGYSNSSGYSDYLWNSIHVLAFGTAYQLNKLALRAGLNYSPSPIVDAAGEAGTATVQGHTLFQGTVSTLNIGAFPAFTQANITVGAGYDVSEDLGIDLAFLFAPKSTRTRSGTIPAGPQAGAYTYTGAASQWAISAGARYRL